MSRHIVCVDVETNGLDISRHQAVEVAWWNLGTDKGGDFVPSHNHRMVLHDAEIEALRINRYIDRGIPDLMLDPGCTAEAVGDLWEVLEGATVLGSNPTFDAAMLTKLFDHWGAPRPPWHHRMWDLSAYAAGVLSLDELPGLHRVCELLDISTRPDHTAKGDVEATVTCFLDLQARAVRAKAASR